MLISFLIAHKSETALPFKLNIQFSVSDSVKILLSVLMSQCNLMHLPQLSSKFTTVPTSVFLMTKVLEILR